MEAHKQNFAVVDETLIFQGHLNIFWSSFMALLCSSTWSDQKCRKTECVALKISFQTRRMWALWTHYLARYRFLRWGSKFCIYKTLKILKDFSRENHGHGGHEHGVCRWFSGVSFHLRRRPHVVASVLCKKTPIFGSRRSKLDHLSWPDASFPSFYLTSLVPWCSLFSPRLSNRIMYGLANKSNMFAQIHSCVKRFERHFCYDSVEVERKPLNPNGRM
jgi:hypothetical protein